MGGVFFGWLLAEGAVPGAETMLGGTFMLAGLAVVLIGGEARQKRLASLEVTAEGAPTALVVARVIHWPLAWWRRQQEI